jgi:hypothetical protein
VNAFLENIMRFKSVGMRVVFIVLLKSIAFAQEMPEEKPKEEPKYGWQKEMVGGINLTQTSFSNWTQGGENSFAWQFNLNFRFENEKKKTNWANSGKFTYGATKLGEQGLRKSLDEIKVESVFTYKLNAHVNPFAAATGETQFGPGYNYETEQKTQISGFFDPAYFRESFGMGFKPNKIVRTRLGLALKQTITSDFPIPYADDPDTVEKVEKFKNEAGLESVTDVNWKVSKKTLFISKLELFYNFETLNRTDVRWDNVLTVELTKHLNVNFNFKLLYDRDISSRRQIMQSIALGLIYNFLGEELTRPESSL